MAKKVFFCAIKAIVNKFFPFFCDYLVTFMWESNLERKKNGKITNDFFIAF